MITSEVWGLAAQGPNGFNCAGEEVFNYGREATMEEKQLLIKALDRLENGDVLGSAELLGDCYSSEAEEALDILSEGDVDSTAIAAAHIRKAIESYD